MPKSKLKIEIVKGTAFELKPDGKYLLIVNRKDVDKGDLKQLDPALKAFFGETKVMAIFADQMTDIKIAELLEETE